MMRPHLLRRVALTSLLGLGLLVADRSPASAQPAAPWGGVVVADEARTTEPTGDGMTELAPHALSGDGRYLVFSSERTLTPGDTNGVADVFVRDRVTGMLTRVSVSSLGEQADGLSNAPSISRDGRHIIFVSCATNLVPDDVNYQCDVFAHDRLGAITTLISTGPNGESSQFVWQYHNYAISADGRYVTFGARLDQSPVYLDAWFRDRDADADGVFDEPGETTTTRISQPAIGGLTLHMVHSLAMSADGRWIAINASTTDPATDNAVRMFLHDRTTSTTVVVDAPQYPHDPIGWQTNSFGPDLSDDGHLAYYSARPGLVPEASGSEVAYVVDPATLQHTKVQQTHAGGAEYFGWGTSLQPAISADARYVTYVETTYWTNYMYVADMQTGISYDVLRHDEGEWDEWPGIMSLSADATGIAFAAGPQVFPTTGLSGLFVANRVTMSPSVIEVANDAGGPFSFTLDLPAWLSWELNVELAPDLYDLAPLSGTGPATIGGSAWENWGTTDRDNILSFGSAQVTIRQIVPPSFYGASPYSGSLSGGTTVYIYGQNFKEGVTVSFAGVAATSVERLSSYQLMVTTPPYSTAEWVTVKVANPDGAFVEEPWGFLYEAEGDTTPPVLSPAVTGTLGSNGWYVSDVQVA